MELLVYGLNMLITNVKIFRDCKLLDNFEEYCFTLDILGCLGLGNAFVCYDDWPYTGSLLMGTLQCHWIESPPHSHV